MNVNKETIVRDLDGQLDADGNYLDPIEEERLAQGVEAFTEAENIAGGVMSGIQKAATDQAISTATSEEPVVGEPSAPIAANPGAKFSAWAARKLSKGFQTSVKPDPKGLTNHALRMRESVAATPGGVETPAPTQSVAEMLSNGDYESFLDRVAEGNLDKFNDSLPHQTNFNTYSSDEVSMVFAETAEKLKELIAKQKRGDKDGKLSLKKIEELAKIKLSDPKFVENMLGKSAGSTVPAEELAALQMVTTLLASDISKFARNYKNLPEEDLIKYRKANALFEQLVTVEKALQTEGGRLGAAANIESASGGKGAKDNIYASMQQAENGLTEEGIAGLQAMSENPAELKATHEATKPSTVSKMYDTVHEVFVNGILSGIKTHMVNGVGGWLKMGINVADTFVAARMPTGNVIDPLDIVHASEWKANVAGMTTAWQEALNIATRSFKHAENYGDMSKLEADARVQKISSSFWEVDPASFTGTTIDNVGAFINFPTRRLMAATDAFNKKIAERGYIVQAAFRYSDALANENDLPQNEAIALFQELVQNPTEEIKLAAKSHGEDMTFQTDLESWGKTLQKGSSLPVVNAIIPFFKTPANILKEAYVLRTPVALMTERYKADIKAGGMRSQMARAKIINGTMLYGSAVGLAMSGKVTGAYSRDPDVRKAQQDAGWMPYSIKMQESDGSTSYVSYQRLEPFSYIFGIAADVSQVSEEFQHQPFGEEDSDRLTRITSAVIIGISNNTLDKTFMTGVQDFMEAATKGDTSARYYVQNFINSRIPYSGARRDVGSISDQDRLLYTKVGDYVTDQVSMLWKDAPAAVDILGVNVPNNSKFIPWMPTKGKRDRIYLENLELTRLTRKPGITRMPMKYNGVPLTAQQYHDVMKYSRSEFENEGMKFEDKVRETIQSNGYRNAYPEAKQKILRSIQSNYDEAGWKWLRDTDLDFDMKVKRTKASEVVNYNAFKNGSSKAEEWNKLEEVFKASR